MNEDQWRNQQLNKYLDYEECSNSLEDFRIEEKENYLIDKADDERNEI